MFKHTSEGLRLLLVHPGGPFWQNRDAGAWSIPKGEPAPGEDAAAAARREFAEEVGPPPAGEFHPLGDIVQPGGKRVTAFAVEGDVDTGAVRSNRFTIEWPPRSGKRQAFPEIDRAQWFSPEEADAKILPAQRPFIARLLAQLGMPR